MPLHLPTHQNYTAVFCSDILYIDMTFLAQKIHISVSAYKLLLILFLSLLFCLSVPLPPLSLSHCVSLPLPSPSLSFFLYSSHSVPPFPVSFFLSLYSSQAPPPLSLYSFFFFSLSPSPPLPPFSPSFTTLSPSLSRLLILLKTRRRDRQPATERATRSVDKQTG